MTTKRRRTTKSSTKSTEIEQETPNEPVQQPQPVTVSIPEPPRAPEPMEAPSARFIPLEEAPMPTAPEKPPVQEKPVVIARSAPQPRQTMQEQERIGDILRHVRQSRREALDDIAEYLRIRPSFLSALEASAYEQLPADAYVIGFLRTYANYLGLDGRAAIDQYRHEMSGRRNKPQLTMPQPVSEGPAPTIALLISALLAALLLYALWYAFASTDRAEVSLTPPLPQAAVVEEKPAEDKSVTLQAAPGQAAPADQAQQPQAQPEAAQQPAATAPAQPATPAPATSAPATPPAPEAQAKPESHPKPEPQAPAKVEKPQAAAPAEQPAQPKAPEAKTAETKAGEEDQANGKTYGVQPGRARVAIKAMRNSWVLVTDEHGNTIFDKTLKPGETYYVPQGKPLLLTTGNGKGLQMTLDGAPLPTIGADGSVVRGLPLDADALKEKLGSSDQ